MALSLAPTCPEKNAKKPQGKSLAVFLYGGDKRNRTAGLLNAIQALSHLSYTPMFGRDDRI